tara:strand:+ start:11370 stop:11924 length:555 start_codon:yes stop_codon:yes gene_type:complete
MSFSTHHHSNIIKKNSNVNKILRIDSKSSNLSQLSSSTNHTKKKHKYIENRGDVKLANQKIMYLQSFIDNGEEHVYGKFLENIKKELQTLKKNIPYKSKYQKKYKYSEKLYLEDGYIIKIIPNKGYGFIASYAKNKNLIFYYNNLSLKFLSNINLGKKVQFNRKTTNKRSDIAINIIDFYDDFN